MKRIIDWLAISWIVFEMMDETRAYFRNKQPDRKEVELEWVDNGPGSYLPGGGGGRYVTRAPGGGAP
jgi:hypothetical protein